MVTKMYLVGGLIIIAGRHLVKYQFAYLQASKLFLPFLGSPLPFGDHFGLESNKMADNL